MSKRHSKGVRFFCNPDELKTVLEPVLAESGARLCIAEKRGKRWFLVDGAPPETTKARYPKFYPCHPAMTSAEGLDSLANIVQVWYPVLEESRLRMGEIGMLVTDSELPAKLRELQEDIYRETRKVLTKSFRRGVWARNSNTGGEHFYRDILISEGAVRAYDQGMVLATQMGDGFVTYHMQRFAS